MNNNVQRYILRYNLTTQQAERWAAYAQMPIADLPAGVRNIINRHLRQMGDRLPEADVIAEAIAEYVAHRYGEPITVALSSDGTPATFTWRGEVYTVVEVLGKWHLMDRWWERDQEATKSRDTSLRTRANRYWGSAHETDKIVR